MKFFFVPMYLDVKLNYILSQFEYAPDGVSHARHTGQDFVPVSHSVYFQGDKTLFVNHPSLKL